MKNYKIVIRLLSDTLPGSGEGYGAVIDADIVFDKVGIPFIPAKRIKGCLREAANDVCAMLAESKAGILAIDLAKESEKRPENEERLGNENHLGNEDHLEKKDYRIVNKLFGKRGRKESAPLYFSNFTIPEYKENSYALCYFQNTYPAIISPENVVQTFTYLRQNTAIHKGTGTTEDKAAGTAEDHSLRTLRVLKKGFKFEGEILMEIEDNQVEQLLAIACLNLRRIGTKRRRGFGEVECKLFSSNQEIKVNLL